MDLHPDAEVAILGSRFAEDLLTAIRARGTRLDRGFLNPAVPVQSGDRPPSLPLRRGVVSDVSVSTRWIPYGRLHASASVRIGHEVQDQLVSTGFFALTSGRALPPALTDAVSAGLSGGFVRTNPGAYDTAPARALTELLPAMLGDVEEGLADTVAAAEAEAKRSLDRELARLERYYGELIAEARRRRTAATDDAIRAYQGDLERRRAEEVARNEAKVDLRPTQIEVFHALAQQAAFTLQDNGHSGVLNGHRLLLGDSLWAVSCPNCHSSPDEWAVCTGGHVLCGSCSIACSACGATSCDEHGGGSCSGGEGAPHGLCADHLLDCPSCNRGHCAEHSGMCATDKHPACLECLGDCEVCGAKVCQRHSTATTPGIFLPTEEAPAQRARTLCSDCVRHCRGLKYEIRGRDEVELCQTCGSSVCHEHSAVCDATNTVHCETHLARTDRSRRLVGPLHQARCGAEPELLFASDELEACGSCGDKFCRDHSVACYSDGAAFCLDHAVGLREGEYSCAEHHGVCVVDQRAERSSALTRCPVCASSACSQHLVECKSCGATVCDNDYDAKPKTCNTCGALRAVAQPDDALLDALAELVPNSGSPLRWEVARDATRRVSRVTLSRWGKAVTFAVDHGSAFAGSAIQHGLVLSKRLR